MQSQLSGKYPDLSAAVAGFVATGATQAIDYENDNSSFVTDRTLAERRREVFARVEAERIRVEKAAAAERAAEAQAAAARRAATQTSKNNRNTGRTTGKSYNYCISQQLKRKLSSDRNLIAFTNKCSFWVICKRRGLSNAVVSLPANLSQTASTTYGFVKSTDTCKKR